MTNQPNNLTPQLNDVQLKANIDALQKGGMSNDGVQAYVNNYQKGPNGYVLKTAQVQQPIQPPQSTLSKVSGGITNVAQSLTGIPNVAKDVGAAIGLPIATANLNASNKRVDEMITEALKLPHGDPQKTALLKQASDLSGQISAKAQSNLDTTSTPGQAARDIAGAGLKTGSFAVGGGALGTGESLAAQGFKAGAMAGGLQGAGSAIEQKGAGVGDVAQGTLKGAFVGGAVGGAIGKVIPAISKGINMLKNAPQAVSDLIKGKSITDILATPETDLAKLNPTERQAWFDNAKQQITAKHEAVATGIQTDLQNKVIASQEKALELKTQLATATRDKVLELRPKIIKAMGEQSATYRQLVTEELAPHANVPVKTTELNDYINNRFADNPEMATAIKQKLGTVENVNALSDPTNVVSKVKTETTLGELYSRTQSLKQTIGSSARKGSAVFTPADNLTNDAISTLSDFMKQNGVDLKNANKFWAEYAPVRNQLVAEAKPFVQSGTQTKVFASTLSRVAKGADVNNENFIASVEDLVGQPITKEAKAVVAKMATNEKQALIDKMSAESAKIDNAMAKDASLKKLSAQQFEIERSVRLKEAIKKVIKYGVPTIVGEEVIRRL